MGEIRITSGRFRGRKIATPEGDATRPLLTRLRKSLADILRPRLPGARLLDLFGGSGAIALELLSNGAKSAVIVELSPSAAKRVGENVQHLGAQAEVLVGDAIAAIERLAARGERFGLILVAPPYGQGLQARAMDALCVHPLHEPGGVAVVQREVSEPYWAPAGPFEAAGTRAYGRTVFDFYEARLP